MRPRQAVLTGSTGGQQRLRYGLGEHKPYRWHGKPGWNPARVLDGWRSAHRRDRACHYCGAPVGEPCVSKAGNVSHTTHSGR